MTTYAEIAERLLQFEARELGEGATEEDVVRAERALGLQIRGGYRQFLRQFGWGGVGHLELYGLGRGVPEHLDLIRITLSERREMQPSLRVDLVPIMNDGGGNLYCLATSTEMDEPVVVFWDHEAGQDQQAETDVVDFAAWLDRRLDDL